MRPLIGRARECHASMREASGVSVPLGTADAEKVFHFHCILLVYYPYMNPSESPSTAASIRGHVENGVVVLDDNVSLNDGQAVRIEPVSSGTEAQIDSERADRVHKLKQLFAEWTDEDGKLTDEEADRLHEALDRSRGIRFRPASVN